MNPERHPPSRAAIPAAGRNAGRIGLLAALTVLLCACAGPRTVTPEPPSTALPAADETAGSHWWAVRFFIAGAPGREPAWHVDALLGDRFVAPVLGGPAGTLALWRIHRRAAPDEAGHRFSFYFHASAARARAVNARLDANPLVGRLIASGVLSAAEPADLESPGPAGVDGFSDAAWPAEMQRAWPWFAMGASETWLRLVREAAAADRPPDDAPAARLVEHYRGANRRVNALWRDHGQHVYLHHLSAVFGYQPLVLRDALQWRF